MGRRNPRTTFELDADAKRLNQELDKTGKKIDQTGQKLEQTGEKGFTSFKAKLLGGIGLATAGLAAFFNKVNDTVQSASELEEANSKLNVVFRDLKTQTAGVLEDLQKNYGLSAIEANKLLGATGDLLTGFGIQQNRALELSTTVQKLAVDLASFSNAEGGAEAVSQALTKALLGETESLKTYGIAIRQADVEQQLLADGKSNLTGLALQQAKAEATLTLALNQSKNAIGDYARTSDSFANVQRRVDSTFSDISTNIGRYFLPAATSTLRVVEDLASGFNRLIEESPSEELERQRIEINALTGAILSANDNEKIRLDLIKDLQKEFPDFLKNLDTEKITNEDIAKALKDYNDETLKRIQLLAVQEDQQNAIRVATDKLLIARQKAREINKLYVETLGDEADVTLSLEEKIDAINKKRQEESATRASYLGLNQQATILQTQYNDALNEHNEAQQEAVDFLKELNELQAKYNISLSGENENETTSINNKNALNKMLQEQILLQTTLNQIKNEEIIVTEELENYLKNLAETRATEAQAIQEFYAQNVWNPEQAKEYWEQVLSTAEEGSLEYIKILHKIRSIEQSQAQAKQQQESAKQQAIGDTAQALVNFASINSAQSKNSFELAKNAAVAQALVKTYLGVAGAFADTNGDIFTRLAAAAVALTSGLAAVTNIQQQQYTGFAEGGRIDRPTRGIIGEAGQPEIIAPEKDFIQVVNDLTNSGRIGGGTASDRLLKETRKTNILLNQLLSRQYKIKKGDIVESYNRGLSNNLVKK